MENLFKTEPKIVALYKNNELNLRGNLEREIFKFFKCYEKSNRVKFSDRVKNKLYSIVEQDTDDESDNDESDDYESDNDESDNDESDTEYIVGDNDKYQELKLLIFFLNNFNVKYNVEFIDIDKNDHIYDIMCLGKNTHYNNTCTMNNIFRSMMSNTKKFVEFLKRDDNKITFDRYGIIIENDNQLELLYELEDIYGDDIYIIGNRNHITIRPSTPCVMLLDHIKNKNIDPSDFNYINYNIEVAKEIEKLIEIFGIDELVDRMCKCSIYAGVPISKLKMLLSFVDDTTNLDKILNLLLNNSHCAFYLDTINILINKGASMSLFQSIIDAKYENKKNSDIDNINDMIANGISHETFFKFFLSSRR